MIALETKVLFSQRLWPAERHAASEHVRRHRFAARCLTARNGTPLRARLFGPTLW